MTDETKQTEPKLTDEQIREIAIERASAVMASHFNDLVQSSRTFAEVFRGATNEQRWMVPVPVSLPVFTALCALAGEHPAVTAALEKLDKARDAELAAARAQQNSANYPKVH